MSIADDILSILSPDKSKAMTSSAVFDLCKSAEDLKQVSTLLSLLYSEGKISRQDCTIGRAKFEYWKQPTATPTNAPKNFLEAPTTEVDNAEWDEKRADIIGQNGNDGHHYQKRLNDATTEEWDKAYHQHLDSIEAKLDEPAPPKEEPKPTPSTNKISLKREEIFTLTINNIELTGMQKESEWEGFIKLKNTTGSVILTSDESNTDKVFNMAFGGQFAKEPNYQLIKASPQIIELLKS